MQEKNNEKEKIDLPCPQNDCTYVGPSNSALKQHHNAAHLGIRFPCTLCPKQFSDKTNLKKHYVNVH